MQGIFWQSVWLLVRFLYRGKEISQGVKIEARSRGKGLVVDREAVEQVSIHPQDCPQRHLSPFPLVFLLFYIPKFLSLKQSCPPRAEICASYLLFHVYIYLKISSQISFCCTFSMETQKTRKLEAHFYKKIFSGTRA